ncbi:ATP-binding protein [Nannocystis sp.]|uniref:sensor histidine kinase n=1 Tax=Nannocystis sp. TaxID=1962667 RepID=UPI0024226CD9|nr:ATP-binding protein [Nannocystis sp.]MBK7824440.1 GAF domain-containing protein [Nannocystis sp.]MBK9753310.1 GAF domain-containing protein [Nannocystis sp.]
MPRKSSTPLALHEVIRIVGAEHAYLFLGAESSERLVLRSARDAEGRELGDVTGSCSAVVERVRMSREPLAVSGAADGSVSIDGSPLPPRRVLAAPLLLGHRLFGVLYLDRGLARPAFTEGDVEILTAIADHLALALETAHTERLARSQEAALHANRAKSAFIAHMSHELRTPLTAILGYSELLEEEFQDRGDTIYIPDVQRVQSAAKHLLALINNMLDLSKIEAGKMELYLEDFPLAEVVEEAVMTVLPMLERGATGFVRNYPAELGAVRLDRMKVRQVLLNLLGNAAKFTAGGQIELAVWREAEAGGEQVVLRVSDTGIGMSPEQIKRIFEEFAQGSAATTRRYGGTGLGLAISRSFCQRMGGDIEVASSLGEGSTFTVRLPAELDEAEAEDGEADDPRAAEAPLDLDDPPDDAGSSMRSGIFPWPV